MTDGVGVCAPAVEDAPAIGAAPPALIVKVQQNLPPPSNYGVDEGACPNFWSYHPPCDATPVPTNPPIDPTTPQNAGGWEEYCGAIDGVAPLATTTCTGTVVDPPGGTYQALYIGLDLNQDGTISQRPGLLDEPIVYNGWNLSSSPSGRATNSGNITNPLNQSVRVIAYPVDGPFVDNVFGGEVEITCTQILPVLPAVLPYASPVWVASGNATLAGAAAILGDAGCFGHEESGVIGQVTTMTSYNLAGASSIEFVAKFETSDAVAYDGLRVNILGDDGNVYTLGEFNPHPTWGDCVSMDAHISAPLAGVPVSSGRIQFLVYQDSADDLTQVTVSVPVII